jgi:hypothetical protein
MPVIIFKANLGSKFSPIALSRKYICFPYFWKIKSPITIVRLSRTLNNGIISQLDKIGLFYLFITLPFFPFTIQFSPLHWPCHHCPKSEKTNKQKTQKNTTLYALHCFWLILWALSKFYFGSLMFSSKCYKSQFDCCKNLKTS